MMKKELANRKITKESIDSTRRQLNIWDAAEEGSMARLIYLLEENPSAVHKTHESGYATALHYAARAGNFDCVSFLLEKGARPNARTASEETPLHYAAEHGHTSVARLLIEKGADPTLTNYYRVGNEVGRDTPRDVAVYFKRPAIVELIDEFLEARNH